MEPRIDSPTIAVPDAPEPGLHSLTPQLVVRDPAAASAWYQRALGAVEERRVSFLHDTTLAIELRFGDSTMVVAGEFPALGRLSPLETGGTAVVLHLDVADADTALERALEAGAEVVHALVDQFWGERQGQIRDPFGHRWNLAQRLGDGYQAELAEAAAAVFGG